VLLATDLDGTFLGGRQADRLALYRALAARPDVTLAFVTGRGVESVLPLFSDPLVPTPTYVIADVGATIITAHDLRPVAAVQQPIEDRWIGVSRVVRALSGVKGIRRQRVPQERRCSYLLDDPAALPTVRSRLASLDVDLLLSADRYLDVLPRGVSKGAALVALIDEMGIAPDDVIVAGDTLNDLSMFEVGLPGIVVGDAEPALAAATQHTLRVVHATLTGAGGILEGTAALGHPLSPPVPARDIPQAGDAQLVTVYHRLPFEERVVDGRVERRNPRSPNGIIPTLLGSFAGGRPGTWVAWSAPGADAPALPTRELVDESRYPNLVAARVPLTERDVLRFYKRFSKEAFWPIIFGFVERATFSDADWEHFCEINRRFASRAAAEADAGAMVWVHDYNLWMVPGYLRQLRPDLRIGFFAHTSLPPADMFNVIPWAADIAASLAQCDHLAFHVPRYVANCVDILQSHLEVEVVVREPCAPRFRVRGVAIATSDMPTRLRVGDRTVTLGAHPVGVNVRGIRAQLTTADAARGIAELRAQFAGTKVILSVERLDYVKGPLQKLRAFEQLLDADPALRERVTLVFITTPPADGMEAYAKTRDAVDQAVGRINGRFGTLGWTPVRYQYRSVPFAEVLQYYAVADVAWITPLRDGLNLVAKEFVVAQETTGGSGVLVLSEFAGAAVELHGVLLTNPYDVHGMRRTLAAALQIPDEERRRTLRRLAEIVTHHDVDAWTAGMQAALDGVG
jgi:glucosylglycerol-phosphate synthase